VIRVPLRLWPGVVTAPAAVLIRPDGYVAWVADPTDVGLPDALQKLNDQGPVSA